jgi:hypothetical protein
MCLSNIIFQFADARSIIQTELEGVPADYRFLISNHKSLVKVNAAQESKLKGLSIFRRFS